MYVFRKNEKMKTFFYHDAKSLKILKFYLILNIKKLDI